MIVLRSLTLTFSVVRYYWLARVMQVFGVYEKFGVRGQELEDLKVRLRDAICIL